MKKWILTGLVAGLTAWNASAAWWPFGQNRDAEANHAPPSRTESYGNRMQNRRPGRPRLTEEQREQMKARRREMMAQREAVMKLGEAARNETDPVKKEALTDQLRAELNKAADKMHAHHSDRLRKAEKKLDQLRVRMEEAEANRDQMIEKQVERILSGKKPVPPEGRPRVGRPSGE